MPRKPTGATGSNVTLTTAGRNQTEVAIARAHYFGRHRVPVTTSARAAAAAKVNRASSAGPRVSSSSLMTLFAFRSSFAAYVAAKSRFKIGVFVDNTAEDSSPAGVLRVWADEPPGTLDCDNILAPKSTSAKVGSIPSYDYKLVYITIKAPATSGTHTLKVFLDTCSRDAAYIAEATMEYEVIAPPRPDLWMWSAKLSPAVPVAGQECKVAVTVYNGFYLATGPDLKPFRIRLYLDTPDDFVPTCSQTDYTPSILSEPITKKIGVSKFHTYVFNTTALDAPGNTRLTAFVDSNCEIEEESEDLSYNVDSQGYAVVLAVNRLPDLQGDLPDSLPAAVKAGTTFKLKFKVWNYGNADATSVGTVKYWTDRPVEDAVNCTTPGGTSTTFKSIKMKYDTLADKNFASITLPATAPSAVGDYTLWVLVNAECTDLITTNNADYTYFTVESGDASGDAP